MCDVCPKECDPHLHAYVAVILLFHSVTVTHIRFVFPSPELWSHWILTSVFTFHNSRTTYQFTFYHLQRLRVFLSHECSHVKRFRLRAHAIHLHPRVV